MAVDGAASATRSTGHIGSVARLASIFEIEQAARPIFLLGAGASYRSGVPLAVDATNRIAREAYARQRLGTTSVAAVKPSDYMRFLMEHDWFVRGTESFGENFPLAVKNLLVPASYRRDFFSRELRAHNSLSEGYIAFARLAQRGLWRIALTTNFDGCIAEALMRLSPHVRRAVEIDLDQSAAHAFDVYGLHPQIVYLHGRVETYTDRNTPDEIVSFPSWLAELLKPVLNASPIVVVGYRGSEPSIMEGLFDGLRSLTGKFRAGVYWCHLPSEALHPRVKSLQSSIGSNFIDLPIDGFDELLVDLNSKLVSQDIALRVDHAARSAYTPDGPDEVALLDLDMSDLDENVTLATLATYCKRVERPAVSKNTAPGLLVEQGLARLVDGTLRPTVGGFLLFGKEIGERYPHAYIDLTYSGKRRQVIRGNLISQYNQLQQLLASDEVNHEVRLKTDTSSRKVRAYHPRSLTEMLVNLLVHRDYRIEEPGRIDVREGDSIRFVNPGGLDPTIANELLPTGDGQFEPRRTLTFLRNKALADVFYGLGPMDKEGSGLCDAMELMREHGGEARFEIANRNSTFIAELRQARQSNPKSSETAIARHPYGVYITNHLRVALMPETISVAPTHASSKKSRVSETDLFGESDSHHGIFIRQRDRIATFCNPTRFADLASTEMADTMDLQYFLGQKGGPSTVSYLLRMHFVDYLRRFESDGLHVEAGGHRAYFVKRGSDTPVIRYDTAKRQGIEREMVKRREMRSEVFHENEGIAFDVVRFDGTWVFEIKPFYMFTGVDGVAPLPAYQRTRLSTRRMRFDRNPAVRSDLTFWARYLAQGSAVISLANDPDYNLSIESAFHEIEVLESGDDQQGIDPAESTGVA